MAILIAGSPEAQIASCSLQQYELSSGSTQL